MNDPTPDRSGTAPRGLLAGVKNIHVVGVAGMGAGPLAIYLAASGYRVTGEDAHMTPAMRRLLERGQVRITSGYASECDIVVFSSAVPQAHPSLRAALASGTPTARRGEILAAAVAGKKLVAVCGSHGKTTSAAMLISTLRAANFPAGYILGGIFSDDTMPAGVGDNEWVVAEVDESDGTIENFSPEIALIVNLDWDHPDQYRRIQDLDTAFSQLVARTSRAVLLPSGTRDLTSNLAAAARAPVYTFGPQGEFAARRLGAANGITSLQLEGKFSIPAAEVRALGEFNVRNSAGALAAAQLMGAQIKERSLATYAGVRRRQGVLLDSPALTVLEDYAHHPTEITALLGAVRENWASNRRVVAVFQPHRFSRTAQFKAEFARALAPAARLYLLEVYAAGEAPLVGGNSIDLGAAFPADRGQAPEILGSDEVLFAKLNEDRREGDVVLFIGAGDVDSKARAWVNSMAAGKNVAHSLKGRRGTMGAIDNFLQEVRGNLTGGTRILEKEILASRTTLRVGGPAQVLVEPAGEADFSLVVRTAQSLGLPIFLLGRGSNLVVPDEGVNGIVVSLAGENWSRFELLPGNRVRVGAGLRLKNLCGLATKEKLRGFEFLEGIPGNVGGALRMNAGAMGGWMFDVVEQVRIMDASGGCTDRPRAELHVDYRHCAELQNGYALGAVLRAQSEAEVAEIQERIDGYRKKRRESQPREPSAGCIFKNPPQDSAGRLIDQAGLKGRRVGAAEISAVHANFIINRGGATAEDVISLVRQVRAAVKENSGILLEPEVLLFGGDWKKVL